MGIRSHPSLPFNFSTELHERNCLSTSFALERLLLFSLQRQSSLWNFNQPLGASKSHGVQLSFCFISLKKPCHAVARKHSWNWITIPQIFWKFCSFGVNWHQQLLLIQFCPIKLPINLSRKKLALSHIFGSNLCVRIILFYEVILFLLFYFFCFE